MGRIAIIAALIVIAAGYLTPASTWFVATNGNDTWSGTLASPNAQKTDGPFATIGWAKDAVRTARVNAAAPLAVELRGGRHVLTETLVFSPEDSGSATAPVIYRSYKGEQAIISGGRKITGWKQSGKLWTTHIADVSGGTLYFTSLFVNGERRVRARTPNTGKYFFTKSLIRKSAEYNAATLGFNFNGDDIQKWSNLEEASVILFHNWSTSINHFRILNLKKKRLEFWQEVPGFFFGNSVRYYVENIYEALDAPGEWFLHTNGTLSYFPMPGENRATAEVIVPVIDRTLIAMQGDPAKNRYVEYLHFSNISFQHVNALLAVDKVRNSVQAAHVQTGAVLAAGMRNAQFEDCEITHVGEHAVSLKLGCKDNVFRRMNLHDLGGGGIYFGDDQLKEDAAFSIERNVVDNCFIHDGGHIFHAGVGVFMGKCAYGNTISRNEICDLSYSGVSLGWSWSGKQKSMTSNNNIAYNHIHHIGNGVLCDLAGIYTLGVSPGTRINNNLIYDITRFEQGHLGYGGHGIYLDAGSSEILVENNIVYDVRDSGFFPHSYEYPYGDTIRNNIFAFSGAGQLYFTGNKKLHDERQVDFYNNIVYCTNGMAADGVIHDTSKMRFASNCYWDEQKAGIRFMADTFDSWKAKGNDTDSVLADPLFVNAAKRDFRLKPGSPAGKTGYIPTDTVQAGLYGPAAWTALPKKMTNRAFEAAPPLQNAFRIVEDFETADPGSVPADINAGVENKGDSVTVAAVKGSGGIQALKVTDAPGLKFDFDPHWYYRTFMKPGKFAFSCDIMNSGDTPADFYCEMRDWTSVLYAGPSVSVDRDGVIHAGQMKIATVAPGTWFRLQMNFDTSDGAPKTFDVTVTTADGIAGKAVCPFVSEQFKKINWLGFACMSTNTAVYYVDNIDLHAVQ
ncbi:MAG: right-handed parallel beta-helix repeat-containing protein [Spirochaetes bacterium]|nr:right-handed parallel beta-helix repeat-containing protein [Spirochaetota bacterium]